MAFNEKGLGLILESGLEQKNCTIRLFNTIQEYPDTPFTTKTAKFGNVFTPQGQNFAQVNLEDNVIPISQAIGIDVIDVVVGSDVIYQEFVQLNFVNEGSLTFNLSIQVPRGSDFVEVGVRELLKAGVANKSMTCQYFAGIDIVGDPSSFIVTYATTPTLDSQAIKAKIDIAAPSSIVDITSVPVTIGAFRARFTVGTIDFIFKDVNIPFQQPGTLKLNSMELELT